MNRIVLCGQWMLCGWLAGMVAGCTAETPTDRAGQSVPTREAAAMRETSPPAVTSPGSATESNSAPAVAALATPPDANFYESRATGNALRNGTRVTQEQVVIWTRQGTHAYVIIDRIERSEAVFRVGPADEQELRKQGVSDDVIVAMKGTAWR